MRIWSLHPSYLDAKGLVALWRETLLAKHVLLGKTKGYTNHPQLNRFKACKYPVDAIDHYLHHILEEAEKRGYRFDKTKIGTGYKKVKLEVTKGQLDYETGHLRKKLRQRDMIKFKALKGQPQLHTHPMFTVIPGGVEAWEVT